MRFLFTSLVLLFAGFANAKVGAFFLQDDATLLIQGNDNDAEALYQAMNVAPVDDGLKLTKHISLETMYLKPVFDLTCNNSKQTKIASCTLKFFSPSAVINKEHKSVLVGVNDEIDAAQIEKMFNNLMIDPYQAEVFRSEDGALHIWKTFKAGGIASFTIQYN